jgi:hypothetical protein
MGLANEHAENLEKIIGENYRFVREEEHGLLGRINVYQALAR